MIKLIIATIMITGTLSASTGTFSMNKDESAKLCKIFQNKAVKYKKNMREDSYAKNTLKSYQLRAAHYCSK